jgi:hypothetical protein
MRRTGNHVIINWTGITRSTIFFNDILPKEQRRALLGFDHTPRHFGRWLLRACSRRSLPKVLAGAGHLLKGRLSLSLEDWLLDRRLFIDWPSDRRDILLIRDPFNLFASRISMGQGGHRSFFRSRAVEYFPASIALWKQHAREFLGDTNHLPGHVGIFYDLWLIDAGYRREIAARLGIAPDEGALAVVAKEGGGSSFEGMTPLGTDAAQRRLSRYRQLTGENRAMFEVIASDPEILALRERLLCLLPASEVERAIA